MIHDQALIISYEIQLTSAHTDTQIYYITISVAFYMFQPPIVAIFREVFLEVILRRMLKRFTNTNC